VKVLAESREAAMTTQSGGGIVPGVAVTAGDALTGDRDSTTRSTDDGVPVGEADAQADAARTGASDVDDDDTMTDPGNASVPDVPGSAPGTDDGVPVGSADADEDRRRTTGNDASD
jgi:hypothetical protein